MRSLVRCLLMSLTVLHCALATYAAEPAEQTDTTIVVDRVQVTAIKQGKVLRTEPVAATILGAQIIERQHLVDLNALSQRIPNFHAPAYGSRMTSTLYVRGLGTRIDQPVVGLNVDNVPVMNKDAYDSELTDIARIEVLRGPQSTLYGRNTLGGVINIYTLSPFDYQGVRLLAEYSSGNSYRLRASAYERLGERLGTSVTAFYTATDGRYTNLDTRRRCDNERLYGARWKLQGRPSERLRVDNTLSFSVLDGGGYPYAWAEREPLMEDSEVVIRPGEIRYNDPAGYRRTSLTEGLTLAYETEHYTLSSITSYHYLDDCMRLDQDFLPLSYFTLEQARREHTVTEDLVLRSRRQGGYNYLFGLFVFYRHSRMEAPVNFKRTGIERLILANANNNDVGLHYDIATDLLPLESSFRLPACGAAIYHESRYQWGHWTLTAGLRADFEHTVMRYHSRASLPYHLTTPTREVDATAEINDRNTLKHNYLELLPKASLMYAFDPMRNLYVTLSRGYKAGGFNTQMFSDILQERLRGQMVSGVDKADPEAMSYRPEYSWNFEAGGHFSCAEGAIRGDVALFWLECRDQQLTVFPAGSSTGRMMTNAGRTRSRGVEMSMQLHPLRSTTIDLAYGFTDARFRRYDNGQGDYRGKRLPYAPQHTLSAGATWCHPTGVRWLGDLVLHAGMQGAGKIAWNEANTLVEPFYATLEASIRIEHPRYAVSLWGENLTDDRHNVFYFMSMGHEFTQRCRPRTLGITLSINI